MKGPLEDFTAFVCEKQLDANYYVFALIVVHLELNMFLLSIINTIYSFPIDGII